MTLDDISRLYGLGGARLWCIRIEVQPEICFFPGGDQVENVFFVKAPAAPDATPGDHPVLSQSVNGSHMDVEKLRYLRCGDDVFHSSWLLLLR